MILNGLMNLTFRNSADSQLLHCGPAAPCKIGRHIRALIGAARVRRGNELTSSGQGWLCARNPIASLN